MQVQVIRVRWVRLEDRDVVEPPPIRIRDQLEPTLPPIKHGFGSIGLLAGCQREDSIRAHFLADEPDPLFRALPCAHHIAAVALVQRTLYSLTTRPRPAEALRQLLRIDQF